MDIQYTNGIGLSQHFDSKLILKCNNNFDDILKIVLGHNANIIE